MGVTGTKATREAVKVLRTYADGAVWGELRADQAGQQFLSGLIPSYMNAAERNGYNAEDVMKDAASVVRTELNTKLFAALERKDKKDIEKYTAALMRVNGTILSVARSFYARQRKQRNPRTLTPLEIDALIEAFNGVSNVPVNVRN